MKNFHIFGVYGKICFFSQKKQYMVAREDCLKEGGRGLGQLTDLREWLGAWQT